MLKYRTSFCDGISRREMVQAGLAGLAGISLPDILKLQARSAEAGTGGRNDTSIIFIEQAGGPTQHETYDPKPNAPSEYRGPLSAIPTALPGVQFSEVMPEQAAIADHMAVIRSVFHDSGSHGTSSHLTQTGYYLRDRQNRENEMPCFGSVTARVRGAHRPGMPAFVSLPSPTRFGGAGWLGKGYGPFTTGRNADQANFQVPNITLLNGLTTDRLKDRRALLSGFDASRQMIDNRGVADAIDDFTTQAFDMVTGDEARAAFDIDAEDPKVRDRYGRTGVGQNVLLARRLVERGVTVATVRTTGWDDHPKIGERMRSKGPAYDKAVAALIRDLHDRGLDGKVMVVCMGEFGRTPRVNKNAGRDHWGRVMSVALAGGGLPVGQIIGSSDANGGVPVDRPWRPENILAVMYRHLGIDPAMTFEDQSGRPRYILERREPVAELV